MAKLLAKAPIRRGAAKGRTHVAKIKNLKNHPDKKNHTKNSVCIN
jgi:hypothetical protein